MTFAVDLQRFAEKAKDRADEAVGTIVVAIAAELDKRSPVGDPSRWTEEFKEVGQRLGWYGAGYVGGRFRGNWQLGVDVRIRSALNRIDPDGKETQAAIEAAIPDEASGRVYNLSNNVPYAMQLEMGYSKQAPTGIVGLTATMFQQIVREKVEAML